MVGLAYCGRVCAMKSDWNSLENDRLTVYFGTARPSFAAGLLENAALTVDRLKAFFGEDAAAFWQQETRPAVYLYNSRQEYLTATGQPAWSDGVSIQRLRVVYSFVSAKDLADKVIAHELAHIMLKELVGFDNNALPLWFEEGVASAGENLDSRAIKAVLRKRAFSRKLIPLAELNAMHVLRDRTDKAALNRFYQQSYGLVDFLRNGPQGQRFPAFLRALRDGLDFEQALQLVYDIPGTAGLEKVWLDYLRQP